MFAKQKRLTTNPLTFKEGIRFDFDVHAALDDDKVKMSITSF
jgi:hypothetical protein